MLGTPGSMLYYNLFHGLHHPSTQVFSTMPCKLVDASPKPTPCVTDLNWRATQHRQLLWAKTRYSTRFLQSVSIAVLHDSEPCLYGDNKPHYESPQGDEGNPYTHGL